jgi:hypothetical protein
MWMDRLSSLAPDGWPIARCSDLAFSPRIVEAHGNKAAGQRSNMESGGSMFD